MNVVISKSSPSDVKKWNSLAEENGNLLQSTYYDKIQSFYRQEPLYIQLFSYDQLLGGVKLYHYNPKSLPWLYKQITVFGDYLVDPELTMDMKIEIESNLKNQIKSLIKSEGITYFKAGNFYGNTSIQLEGKNSSRSKWGINHINLSLNEDELLSLIHVKHRNMINKAKRSDLVFERSKDIKQFIALLNETYKGQEANSPNPEYINHLFSSLSENSSIYFVKSKDGDYLSGALVQEFGTVADYTFGGNVKNNLGSGQFLQYNIFLDLKKRGFGKYFLGQVALDNLNGDTKFNTGISKFKNRFGGETNEGEGIELICNPIKYKVWKALVKLKN